MSNDKPKDPVTTPTSGQYITFDDPRRFSPASKLRSQLSHPANVLGLKRLVELAVEVGPEGINCLLNNVYRDIIRELRRNHKDYSYNAIQGQIERSTATYQLLEQASDFNLDG